MKIAEPITLRGRKIRNRTVMPPMVSGYATGGRATKKLINYYSRQAAGGVGLIVVEATCVDPSGLSWDIHLRADNDRYLPGLTELARRIKAHGARVLLQIHHGGRQTHILEEAVAPSAVACPRVKVPTRALTLREVRRLERAFARAAERAAVAGFDGVEIHGAHGYLINQFLSPHTNRRSDEYGGGLEGRLRFALRVVKRVRGALGQRRIMGFRISADEFLPRGLKPDESVEMMRRLVAEGVDVVHVTAGTYESLFSKRHARRVLKGPGRYIPLARAMRREVSAPVIAVGQLDESALARRAVARTWADMVAVGRGMLADPEWPRKVLRRRDGEILQCIYCPECTFHAEGCPI
jgi:2,4-dienoyl-CoA reductase-like NADH-dependent reductase (Old Yellow Enzyme family)